jgi:hypothetical protein
MCRMCEDPSLTPADMRAEMFAMIDKHGWMIQYVEAEAGHRAFAYTIGLTALDLPELCVDGLPAAASGQLLNAAARAMVDGGLGPCDVWAGPDGREYLLGLKVDAGALLGAVEVFGAGVNAIELSRF